MQDSMEYLRKLMGKLLAGTLDGKDVKFVKDNLAAIAEGIRRIYGG